MKLEKILIDYQPHEFQLLVHNSSKRFRTVVCGRRFGKTTLAVNEIIKFALTNKNARIWYVSPTYRQTKMIAFDMIKRYIPSQLVEKINLSDLSFSLKNGSEISLKGADNPDNLRGVGLDFCVLDEFATMNKKAWEEAIRPMLLDRNGKAIFIGTPKGRNHFYDIFLKNDEQYQSFHFPTSSNPYIPLKEIEQAKSDMSERLFQQEFLAEFLDEDTGVFRRIRACIVGELKEPILGRYYVLGVDLAKSEDFTVLTVIDSTTRELVAFERFQDVSWREQKVRIQRLANRYNNALVVVDSTGVGDPIFEDLQASNISVEGFKFTNESKMQLVEQLVMAIEQRQITFPRIDVLIDELMNYEYTITDHGRIKYGAPQGKHDDCVISLGLAVWGIRSYLHSAAVLIARPEGEVIDRQGQGYINEEYVKEEFSYAGY